MINKNTIKQIYNALQDEMSKFIYINRLLYSLTGDFLLLRNKDNLNNEYMQKVLRKTSKFVLYGAGKIGESLFEDFPSMEILGVCDNAIAKWGTKFHGYIVMSPDELLEKHKNSLILVAVLDFRTQKSIKENLINQGFDKNKILLFNSSNYSEWAYNDLYFPSDIPLQFSNNEVFVDAGCYDFNTSLDFIHNMNSEYKKIIAFEPNPGQYNICLENAKNIKNVMIYECGLWNKSTTLNFSSSKDIPSSSHVIYNNRKTNIEIKAVKLDDILNGDEATYIKMDIEGAELNALKGAEQTIKKYRPKLAISIYHKLEDIWEIPEYLLKLNRNYKLYIRHHYIIGYVETVLYAI